MEEQKKEDIIRSIIEKIHKTDLPSDLKQKFMFFCLSYPMSDKHANTFINTIKGSKAIISYLYRHLMRTAVSVGVPKVYITDYYHIKELSKNKYYINNRDEYLLKMQRASMLIFQATLQMVKYHNTRKAKIEKLKYEIELKELEKKKADI